MTNVYKRISNWNTEIIQKINELATNPPDGCDPVAPLPEAERHHIFTKDDVQDAQDKLREMCPDTDFTELDTPQLITVDIISELEGAIVAGWCECNVEPDEQELGNWTCQKVYGTGFEDKCCGIEIEYRDFLSQYTGYDVIVYQSGYYDVGQYTAANSQNTTIVRSTYFIATRESVNWAEKRELELRQQRIVEQKREELQGKEETLAILLQQLAACTVNCSSIQSQIVQIQQEIDDLNTEINEAITRRDRYKEEAITHSDNADAAAATNWSAALAVQSWDPNVINIATLVSSMSAEWGVGEYPYNYVVSRWGVGYWRRYASTGYEESGNAMAGKFTPSGLPYTRRPILIWGSDWWKAWKKQHCCGIWDMWAGRCNVGACLDWENFESLSDLPSVNQEGNTLRLLLGITRGTEKVDYVS